MFGLSITEWLVIGGLQVICTIGSFAEWKDMNKE